MPYFPKPLKKDAPVVRARAWLRLNKIFFETATTASLSAMALIVSIASLRISSVQTRIQRAQAQPTFVVQPSPIFNEKTQKYDELRFQIRNVGSPVKGFTEVTRSFLVVNYTGKFPKAEEGKVYIPVSGYLPIYIFTSDSTGLLGTLEGHDNTATLAALTDRVDARAKELGGFARTGIMSVVEFDFIDLVGDRQRVYYRVNDFGGAPMDEAEASPLIGLQEKMEKSGEMRDLDKVQSDDVLRQTPLLAAGKVREPSH